jgi:hypothetical protein
MTDSRPGQWRMLATVALELDVDWGTAAAAAKLGEERGWLELQLGHSVQLNGSREVFGKSLVRKNLGRI